MTCPYSSRSPIGKLTAMIRMGSMCRPTERWREPPSGGPANIFSDKLDAGREPVPLGHNHTLPQTLFLLKLGQLAENARAPN